MISLQELVSAVYGAFRLAQFREDGMAYFNVTTAGFWRSFFAAVLVFPPIFMLWAGSAESTNTVHDGIIFILAYVIGWLAFPLAMVPVSELLDRDDRYIPYIVANNWASIPQTLLLIAVVVLRAGFGLSKELTGLLVLAAYAAIFAYMWFVARTALKISGFAAAGVVALSIALTVAIVLTRDSFSTAAPVQ